MTRPSPFLACAIAIEMGILPDDPEGLAILKDWSKWHSAGGEKAYEEKRKAELNRQLISHHKLLVKLEKRI